MIKTEIFRRESAERLVALTIAVKKRVKKVKLTINPVTIPNGRLFPPVSVPESTIGKIGNIHGERIVTIPAKKANRMRINMLSPAHHSR